MRRQLEAGAWGVTAASTAQARLFRAFGAPRVLIANQVVDPAGLRWIAAELESGSAAWLCCLVDSERGVALMERGLAGTGRRLPVLVEMGLPVCRPSDASNYIATYGSARVCAQAAAEVLRP